MIDPDLKAEFDRLHEAITPPLVVDGNGLPATALQRWRVNDESNRLWLGSMMGDSVFRLALEAVQEQRRPVWGSTAPGQDGIINGAMAMARLEGFNDFPEQLRALCLPPMEDPGPIPEHSPEMLKEWGKKTGRYYEPKMPPEMQSEESEPQ
jgi:hypothetical protein